MNHPILRGLALLATIVLAWSPVFPACSVQTPVTTFTPDSWNLNGCQGFTNVMAFVLDDPDGSNTAGAPIFCDAPDDVRCFAPGSPNDPLGTIEFDWAAPGTLGCPVGTGGPRRIVIAASGIASPINGGAILASIAGTSQDWGYVVDLAHPAGSGDPETLACASTVSTVFNAYYYGYVTLRFTPPTIRHDCEPGSFGQSLGDPSVCTDAFAPVVAPGPVYLRRQACLLPVDARRSGWVSTGVTPGADGRATFYAGPSSYPDCVYAGNTVFINGHETPLVLGFFELDTDCQDLDRDGDGYSNCQADCDDFNPLLSPATPELCNGVSDNCDALIDEDELGVDTDTDGLHNVCDNCRLRFNPDQFDHDADGQGELCDFDDGLILVEAPGAGTIAVQAEAGYDSFNLYRGDLELLRSSGLYTQDPATTPLAGRSCGVAAGTLADPPPPAGRAVFYLVTGNVGGVEQGLGTDSAGVPRPNANPCP